MDLLVCMPYSWIECIVFRISVSDSEQDFSFTFKVIFYLQIMRLLRLFKMKRLLFRIEEMFVDSVLNLLFEVIKLLMIIIFIAH